MGKPLHSRAATKERIRQTVVRIISASAILTSFLVAPARAETDNALAQRYRPYIKTSQGRGVDSGDETRRPASWQFIVQHSSLLWQVPGPPAQTLVPLGKWSADFHELTTTPVPIPFGSGTVGLDPNGGDLSQTPYDEGLSLDIDAGAYNGESWQQAAQGHGIYAHVQHVGDLVNIEYTILWTQNRDEARFNVHSGDVTSMVVLYDPTADRIARLTYSMHGCLIAAYRLTPGQAVTPAALAGEDLDGHPTETAAAEVEIPGADEGHDYHGALCSGWTPPEKHVFLLPDPTTHRYEHPAMYAENGTHEPFPNASGYIALGGGHQGNGESYLPATVEVLGSFADPTPTDAPIVHFNGLLGSDPASIVLHRTWCWPPMCGQNNAEISDTPSYSRFTDMNPYAPTIGNLNWPESARAATSGDVYITSNTVLGPATGTMEAPFGDINLACSFTPSGWTLHLEAGNYGGPLLLDRPMTLQARDGRVTIGQL